jgi:hypothetical protein
MVMGTSTNAYSTPPSEGWSHAYVFDSVLTNGCSVDLGPGNESKHAA